MSKKITIALFSLLIFTSGGKSIAQTYTLVVDSLAYTTLTQPKTSLSLNQVWFDPNWEIVLNFNFSFMGMPVDTIWVNHGFLALDANFDYLIEGFGADLADKGSCSGGTTSLSNVSWKTDSSGANKIAIFEFDNAGFQQECDSVSSMNEFTTFQIWLYEGSNDIAMHYGAKLIFSNNIIFYPGATGPFVGLKDYSSSLFYSLQGDPLNPSLVNVDTSLVDAPDENRHYLFDASTIGVDPAASDFPLHIFPVPAYDQLRIHAGISGNATARILDIGGKVILEKQLSTKGVRIDHSFDLSDFQPGIYLLQVSGETGMTAKRFVKL